ncbi:ArsR/SmtB family transcription factor [Sphaerisporangium dianthi]|uniref:Helix-turn-helix domain-containing protein n=1 Tax=Sphaerisporangium dianthi TaxID=1436120 RepID=A0ABV9CPJ5_9ACTN
MITVKFNVSALARTRIAPSPAFEITSWLRLAAANRRHPVFGMADAGARHALRDPDVAMIASVMPPGPHGYVLDLLTPRPGSGPWKQVLAGQLDALSETPIETIAEQLLVERFPNGGMPDGVRRAFDNGTFARRAAAGLHRFWLTALAGQHTWLEAGLAADVAGRGRLMAAHGVGHMLESLHPDLDWTAEEMRIVKPYEGASDLGDSELVLAPSLLGWPNLHVQVCDPLDAFIAYPAGGAAPPPKARTALPGLIGASRAAILRDLGGARSTTELSRRLRLAPSTVSYHLSVLLHSELVSRVRQGPVVRYQRTRAGDALLHDGG